MRLGLRPSNRPPKCAGEDEAHAQTIAVIKVREAEVVLAFEHWRGHGQPYTRQTRATAWKWPAYKGAARFRRTAACNGAEVASLQARQARE